MALLHKKQKALMQELAVPVLDACTASVLSAHELRPVDSVHCAIAFNKQVPQWCGLPIT